jgi:hypothetical protein
MHGSTQPALGRSHASGLADIQHPQAIALVSIELHLPFRRQPHRLHAIKAESPADKLPFVQQERLAAGRRVGEAAQDTAYVRRRGFGKSMAA